MDVSLYRHANKMADETSLGHQLLVFVHYFIKKKKKIKKINIFCTNCGFIFLHLGKEASIPDYISFRADAGNLDPRSWAAAVVFPVRCVGLRSTYLLNICLVVSSDIMSSGEDARRT
jgi:hypothetical protein